MSRARLGRDSNREVLAVGGKRQQLRPQLHRVCVGVGRRAELLSHRTEFVRRAVLQRNMHWSLKIVISPDHTTRTEAQRL
jgi:hypothetical protein